MYVYFPLKMHLSLNVSPLRPRLSDGEDQRYSTGLKTGAPKIRESLILSEALDNVTTSIT